MNLFQIWAKYVKWVKPIAPWIDRKLARLIRLHAWLIIPVVHQKEDEQIIQFLSKWYSVEKVIEIDISKNFNVNMVVTINSIATIVLF